MECKQLTENQVGNNLQFSCAKSGFKNFLFVKVKVLCEKAKEILSKESNVQVLFLQIYIFVLLNNSKWAFTCVPALGLPYISTIPTSELGKSPSYRTQYSFFDPPPPPSYLSLFVCFLLEFVGENLEVHKVLIMFFSSKFFLR